MRRLPLVAAAFAFVVQAAPAANTIAQWPRFRGLHGSGIAESSFPTEFGPESHVTWKTEVPSGHSSPCIWGDRLFLTGFENEKLLVLCYDRLQGRELWRRTLEPGNIERGAQLSNPATATPTTDGEHVWVYFGAFGLACFDLNGQEVWRKPLAIPVTQHGAGTSPVLAGDLLVLNCDQDVGSYLLAVNKHTGETVWRVDRTGFQRGFATPLPYPHEKPEQLIVPGTLRLVSYNLKDGSERWNVRGLPNEMVSSPVAGEGLIFIAGWTFGSGVRRMPPFDELLASGDANKDGRLSREEAPAGPAKQHFPYIDSDKDGLITREEYAAIARAFDESKNVAMAVRPDGHGDVTETHVLWRASRGLPYVPSPLYYDGHIYLVKNGGMATCIEATSGKVLYQEQRLGAIGDYYASPIAADGKVCMVSQQGTAVVLRAGDTLEVLARNPLGEPVVATPAIVDGTIYVRTSSHLYAFGNGEGVSLQPETSR